MNDNEKLFDDLSIAYAEELAPDRFLDEAHDLTINDLDRAVKLLWLYCNVTPCAICKISEFCDANLTSPSLPYEWDIDSHYNITIGGSGLVE